MELTCSGKCKLKLVGRVFMWGHPGYHMQCVNCQLNRVYYIHLLWP